MKANARSGVGVTFLELEGHIDSRSAADFEKGLLPILDLPRPRVLLDFSRVEYIASAGIRVLLGALKTAKARGGEIRCVGIARSLKEIFDIVGLTAHLGIFPARAAALQNFGLDVTETNEQGLRILRLEGNLEKSAGVVLREWLDRLRQESTGTTVIDLAAVNYAAIECLRVLQEGSAQSGGRGTAFVFLRPQQSICEAIEVSGLMGGLRLAKTVEEALRLARGG